MPADPGQNLRRSASDVYAGPYSNGLSDCCHAEPYRINDGPWRCTKCSRSCAPERPQRQDGLQDQMRDVVTMAERAGCYDAADSIKRWFRA